MQELLPAEGVFSLIWVLVALPLIGAAVLLLGGRRTSPSSGQLLSGFIDCGSCGVPSNNRGDMNKSR